MEPVLFSRTEPKDDFANLQWIEGDLENYDDLLGAMQGIDAVQHLGARPNPTDHPRLRSKAHNFDATFKSNMLGTYYLMQAAVAQGVGTVVMAGSNCALGHGYRISNTSFPIKYLPIDEEHPTDVEDTYSYSKLAGEELLASYTRAYGIRTYVTRICGIYPPERKSDLAHNAKSVKGWDDFLWCWIASEDVATAHCMIQAAAERLPPHDVYFLNADDTIALENVKGTGGGLPSGSGTPGQSSGREPVPDQRGQTEKGRGLVSGSLLAGIALGKASTDGPHGTLRGPTAPRATPLRRCTVAPQPGCSCIIYID